MEINPAVTFKHDRSIMYAKRPKVLIVGAGLGGLTLGMLLHKAGIPFDIYDKAPEVKPLGAAMYFNCTTANLFKQCGIYEEFAALGKYVSAIKMCNEQREVEFSIDFEGHEQEFGARGYMITRPALYGLLMRQIPKERIHLGKKVLTMDQGGNGVLIRFSDRTEAEGDILVGADGAYSAVRQGLYAKLKKAGTLPPSDLLPLPFSTVCLVGQTRPLTPEEFPDIAQEQCRMRRTIGTDKMYSWSTYNTAQGTMAYMVIQFLTGESSKENDAFRNSEFGPEAVLAIGGDHKYTMADFFAWSNKEHISKFMLEEKVLKTWYHCRTVLIGDGVGPANAVQDAMVLANLINGLPFHPIAEEIEAAFKAYQVERMPWVKDAHKISQTHRTMVGQSFASKSTRYVSKHIPPWLFNRIQARAFSYRPQVAFLPLAEDNGRVRPAHQPSLSVKAPVGLETVMTRIV
ncbi:hypothetical protein F5H01DRAFT_330670 [Linnemannia elongata]|nr:hypothetical protein F5H01DRAFT_359904 [Linnemannia elongata]KAK5797153.1 hypothetical protein F5H01DRAFT_359332 [Linnemannia elongata]KAK5829613.1 hypothetical protein F5H01DRAFT_330670 [Linnemannia elongata]